MSRGYFSRPPLKRVLWGAVAAVLVTLIAYTGAYLVNVRAGGVPDTFSSGVGYARRGATEPITVVGEREASYRWGGPYAQRLFALANGIDRRLRPGMWTETFVFKPLPAREEQPSRRSVEPEVHRDGADGGPLGDVDGHSPAE